MSTESKMKVGDVVRSKAHNEDAKHPLLTIHKWNFPNWECRILLPDGTYKTVDFNESELELISNA